MMAKPQKEHAWLQKLVGEWSYEHEAIMKPGEPPQKASGVESVRSLGGLWIVAEGRGEMPCGGDATMILTLGYDPQKKRYVGAWAGSIMATLWVYEGTMDASGRVLTLEAEGPAMADPAKMVRYRDVIEVKNDDHRLLTSHVQGEDGQWVQFMTANYRRTK